MAAVLGCGPDAVLSHRSAATLWGIDSRWRNPVEVTAPGAHRIAGVRVHRSRTLRPPHINRHLGIPVTSPARTMLDLADVLDDAALARAVNEAQVIGRLRLGDLATLLDGARGRHGHARLRRFVDGDGPPTRSAFEDTFLKFAERHDLPCPEINQLVEGHEVDMLWRAQRLVVELDGYAFHQYRRPFERDRDRDADLVAAGYSVIRITWQRLTRQTDREMRRLRRLLDPAADSAAVGCEPVPVAAQRLELLL
jgi:Protein of unknown function (DUF559)